MHELLRFATYIRIRVPYIDDFDGTQKLVPENLCIHDEPQKGTNYFSCGNVQTKEKLSLKKNQQVPTPLGFHAKQHTDT